MSPDFSSLVHWILFLPLGAAAFSALFLRRAGGFAAWFSTAAKSFGRLLYTKYLLPLEIAGFLLLAALVGVVSLSKDNPERQA